MISVELSDYEHIQMVIDEFMDSLGKTFTELPNMMTETFESIAKAVRDIYEKGEEMAVGFHGGTDQEVFIVNNKTGETIGCGYLETLETDTWGYREENIEITTRVYSNYQQPSYFFNIQRVIFSGPATIVFFVDDKKEVVKMADYLNPRFDDDRELACLYAVLKHSFNGNGPWANQLKRFRKEIESANGKMTLPVEKAFVKHLVFQMEPKYIGQIEKILEKAEEKGLLTSSKFKGERLYLPEAK